MTELDLLDAAARAMAGQRAVLDVAARNVAAAQAAAPGQSYERLVARFVEAAPPDDDADAADDADVPLTFSRERAEGDPLTELIAVLDAQRAYEANASVFDTGKRLAERTLDIERT
jgi:flagellar basal body rod protein FlgC